MNRIPRDFPPLGEMPQNSTHCGKVHWVSCAKLSFRIWPQASKVKFQRHLYHARAVLLSLCHDPERRAGRVGIGSRKTRVVERVERLEAELQPHPLERPPVLVNADIQFIYAA